MPESTSRQVITGGPIALNRKRKIVPENVIGIPTDVAELYREMLDDPYNLDAEGHCRRFYRYHKATPELYKSLVDRTRTISRRYATDKLGIDLVYASARWDGFLYSIGSDEYLIKPQSDYRLDSRWAAYYARLIMAKERDLSTIFNTRISTSDDWFQRYISLF